MKTEKILYFLFLFYSFLFSFLVYTVTPASTTTAAEAASVGGAGAGVFLPHTPTNGMATATTAGRQMAIPTMEYPPFVLPSAQRTNPAAIKPTHERVASRAASRAVGEARGETTDIVSEADKKQALPYLAARARSNFLAEPLSESKSSLSSGR